MVLRIELLNNITRYTAVQRKLHWVVVLLISSQYLLQVPMRAAMANLERNQTLGAVDFLVTTIHTWGGAAAGAIMVYRLWLRVQRPVPVGAGTLHGPWRWLASGMHWAFYALVLFMVLTGLLHYYLELERAANWHEKGEWLLLGLIGAHVLAALLHHLYKKDAVLGQMWGSKPPH